MTRLVDTPEFTAPDFTAPGFTEEIPLDCPCAGCADAASRSRAAGGRRGGTALHGVRGVVVATVGAVALAGAGSGTAFAEPAPAHAGWDGSKYWFRNAAGYSRSYGYEVVIRHPDGRYTQYAHLSRIDVSPGQRVSAGQRIARSGATGRVTGPHLHFEVRTTPYFGSDVNPLAYLRGHGVPV